MNGDPLLFFAQVALPEVGIPTLAIGADRSLDEQPIFRLLGEDDGGGVLFDWTMAALDDEQLQAVKMCLRYRLQTPPGMELMGREAVESALALIERAQAHRASRLRLTRIAGELAEGEALQLDDEGHTLIRCMGEHPELFGVFRWGGKVGEYDAAHTAVAVALSDYGLQRTDRVVGDG